MKKRFRFFGFKNESGTSLPDVIISVGIMGLIVGGMSQFFGSTIQEKKKFELLAVMGFIAKDIENKLKSPMSIYISLLDDSNTKLIECVLGAGTGCTSELTSFDSIHPNYNYFALNYSTGVTTSLRMTSADASSPILYDKQGAICKKNDSNCVFAAHTFFYASCDPADGKTCTRGPASVSVSYKVSLVPGRLKEFGAAFKSLPGGIHFFTHQLKDILGPFTNSTCNPGAIIQDFDRRGYATCRCSPPFVKGTLPDNRFGPICRKILETELSCADPNLIFRGLNPDGTANCIRPEDAYECITATPVGSLNARCPIGYMVRDDVRSGCKFYCTIPKQDATISCSSNEAKGPSQQFINNVIQPPQYTLSMEDHRKRVSAMYKMGLICQSRTLTCCRPK